VNGSRRPSEDDSYRALVGVRLPGSRRPSGTCSAVRACYRLSSREDRRRVASVTVTRGHRPEVSIVIANYISEALHRARYSVVDGGVFCATVPGLPWGDRHRREPRGLSASTGRSRRGVDPRSRIPRPLRSPAGNCQGSSQTGDAETSRRPEKQGEIASVAFPRNQQRPHGKPWGRFHLRAFGDAEWRRLAGRRFQAG
jgi:hypothetical protein